MKKVIGIYTFYIGANEPFWDEKSDNLGGSETWTIEIANEFQKRGFHVIIFGHPSFWHFSNAGVEYLDRSLLNFRCEFQHFDYFISSRVISELNPDIACDNVYIMSHEAIINLANTYTDLKMNKVKKIACLSVWHANKLMSTYSGLTGDRLFLTMNGVDGDLYKYVDAEKKENMMVWSSCKERGLKNFIDNIFPIIKKEVPDFKLAICAYNNDIPQEYNDIEGITVYGKRSKKELSELQKKSNIWIYPNYGIDAETGYAAHETFCLTAVENGIAKNAIICGYATGLITTLYEYDGFVGKELELDYDTYDWYKMEQLNKLIAEKAIEVLKNKNLMKKLSENAFDICKNYTWENAVNTWINEFNNV